MILNVLRFMFLSLIVLLPISLRAQKYPVNYYRAQASIEQSNHEQAIHWLDTALLKSPRNFQLWIKKGEALYRLNRYENAMLCFRKADEIRKGSSSLWLARTYALMGDTAKVYPNLIEHLSTSQKQPEAQILLDTAFNKITNTPQWKAIWKNQWYSPLETLVADVNYHFSKDECEYAIDLLNEKIKGKKVNHKLFALRAQAYYKVGSLKVAEIDIKQAVAKSKRNHSYISLFAQISLANGNIKKSLSLINRSIELSGGEPSYFLIRASVFAQLKNFAQAIEDMRYYLLFYPNNLEALGQLTDYLVESGKNIEALLNLGVLINKFPNNARYLILRAKIYMKSNGWEVALIDLNQAAQIVNNYPELYFNRGICLYNLNKTEQACTDWAQAVKLGNFNAQELLFKNCRKK